MSMMKLLWNKEPINKSFTVAFGFKDWHGILPENGKC